MENSGDFIENYGSKLVPAVRPLKIEHFRRKNQIKILSWQNFMLNCPLAIFYRIRGGTPRDTAITAFDENYPTSKSSENSAV